MKSKKSKTAIGSHNYIHVFPSTGLRAYIFMNNIPQLVSDLAACIKRLPAALQAQRQRRASIVVASAAALLVVVFGLAFLILDAARSHAGGGSLRMKGGMTATYTGIGEHGTIRQQRSLQADRAADELQAGAAAAQDHNAGHGIAGTTQQDQYHNNIDVQRRQYSDGDHGADAEIGRLLHSLEMMREIDDDEQRGGSFVLVTGDQVDDPSAADRSSACSTPIGTHLLTKAYKNKVDYCSIHGCTVRYILESWPDDDDDDDGGDGDDAHVRRPRRHDPPPPQIISTRAADPPSILLRLMHSHRSVPWFMWMDAQSLFTNLSFAFPFHTYSVWGKHFIVPASAASPRNIQLHEEQHFDVHPESLGGLHGSGAVNPVVFLVKNSEWSCKFLTKWKQLLSSAGGRDHRAALEQVDIADAATAGAAAASSLKADHHAYKNKAAGSGYNSAAGAARSAPNYRDLLAELLVGGIADEDREKVLVEDGYYLDGRGDFVVESHHRVNHIVEQIDLIKQQQQQQPPDGVIYWPFIVDFHGCDLCRSTSTGRRHISTDHPRLPVAAAEAVVVEACVSAFQRAFHFADNQLLSIAGMQHQHLYTTFAH